MNPRIKPLGPALGPLRWTISHPIKSKLKQMGINQPFEHLILLKMLRLSCNVDVLVQQDLAEKLGKDKSVVMRMVDSLEREGLLKRIVDLKDRRRNQLAVTDLGNQLMDKYDNIELETTNELMEGLSDDEIEVFYKVIDHIKMNGDKLYRS